MDMFINGDWHSSFSHKRMDIYDPTISKPFESVPLANSKDANLAIKTSYDAFLVWSRFSMNDRTKILKMCSDGIRDNLDKLSFNLKKELGRPLEGCKNEILSSAKLLEVYIEEGLRIVSEIPVSSSIREKIIVTKEPVGVTIAITPFNYPINLLMFKLGAALVAGCSIIAKPAEETPISTLLLAEIFHMKGLPKGVFNVITGNKNVVKSLIKHKTPRKVAFTGSTETGKSIGIAAMGTMKRLTLELGGQCPAIICSDADLDNAAIEITNHSFRNSGQFCYRVNRIYVQKEVYKLFIHKILENVRNLTFDNSFETGDMGPLINKKIFLNSYRHVQDAVLKGGKIEIGGKRKYGKGFHDGYYFEPTIISNTNENMLLLKEETFGPVIGICKIEDHEQGLTLANNNKFGLAGFIFCKDIITGIDLCERMEVGQVWLNNIQRSSNYVPFGGIKESGIGREKGKYGIESYLEYKTMYLKYG